MVRTQKEQDYVTKKGEEEERKKTKAEWMKENVEVNPGPRPPKWIWLLLVTLHWISLAYRIPGALDIRQAEYESAYDPLKSHQHRRG